MKTIVQKIIKKIKISFDQVMLTILILKNMGYGITGVEEDPLLEKLQLESPQEQLQKKF